MTLRSLASIPENEATLLGLWVKPVSENLGYAYVNHYCCNYVCGNKVTWWQDICFRWWRLGLAITALRTINEVTLHRARLVMGWMTVYGFNFRCGSFISVCDQLPRSTQHDHPFVGRRNEYQPKGLAAVE